MASTNVSGLIRLRGGDLTSVRPLVALVLLLAAPASASAAPFGELPSIATTTFADCTRATGAPGEIVQRINGGAAVQRLGPSGLTEVAALRRTPSTARGPRRDPTAPASSPSPSCARRSARRPSS